MKQRTDSGSESGQDPQAEDREDLGTRDGHMEASFPVVALGASAGGLESLERFFGAMPARPGMAFVVIQHLSPDFRSMMDELLRRHTEMPVAVAQHGVGIEPNRVYLLPPRKEMTLQEGRLWLTDKGQDNVLPQPIDRFFRSLAEDAATRAVAIVLSGSGSDGSRALQDVKRAGGTVLVEDPETAGFDGMPVSAIATGTVDQTGSPAQLARFLIDRTHVGATGQGARNSEPSSPTTEVLRLLHREFGIDFSLYKKGTVSRRIERRVDLLDFTGLEEYLAHLNLDPRERSLLYEDLLIGVTQFFRDPAAFNVIEETVIPDILDRVPPDDEIRVWVAGCATGEEAYSLAMLFHEQLVAIGRPVNIKILATDVHRTSLERASRGLYTETQLEHVSLERRQRFFTTTQDGFRVSNDLRQLVVFAPHNVTKDAPFTRMHLISCRNLLIYLEPEAQQSVLGLFHFGLVSGGHLFLGSSEATAALSSEFTVEDERAKVFKKRRDVRLMAPLGVRLRPSAQPAPAPPPPQQGTKYQLLGVYDQLLERYMPPSLLIDEQGHLVDCFGGAEKLLTLGRRRPSMNVSELVTGELRSVLTAAVQRALKERTAVRYTGVRVGQDEVRHTLTAEPFAVPRSSTDHLLVSIVAEGHGGTHEDTHEDAARAGATEVASEAGRARISQNELDTLEGELTYTRETLQTTIEELQTSNEQLQATNEELAASNEELQSTNEELHSVNEELYTVNAEHQKKNAELREANNDIQHLLEGTGIGTMFLDSHLRIRRYTPRVANVFFLQPQDVGRSIRDFGHKLRRDGLLRDIELVLADGKAIEEEVQDQDGVPYFLRIQPYRPQRAPEDELEQGGDGGPPGRPLPPVDGVVLSLTEISALESIRTRLRGLSAIVESSDDAIIGKDLNGVIMTWNGGAERLYGYTAEEAIGQHVRLIAADDEEDRIERFIEAVRSGGSLEHVETRRKRKDGGLLDVSVTISPIRDRSGEVIGASSIARDITPLKRARRELEQREEHIRMLLESTAEAIFGLGPDGRCTFCNPACARLLGFGHPDQLLGKDMHEVLQLHDLQGAGIARADCPMHQVLTTGEGSHSDAARMRRTDGASFMAEYWSYPVRSGTEVVGAVVTFLDVTERKQAEWELQRAAQRREAFLAMLSHELRNPRGAVLAATKLMQAKGADSTAVAKARDVIARQSSHMARLLDDLLDVARITRGGIELRKSDLDVREACLAAVETVSPAINDKDMRLRMDLPDEPLPVRGDHARLQQVVGNLLSNAVRYSPAGNEIRLGASRVGDEIEIRVEDDGHGIPPHMLSEVFELFVQTERGLARSNGGLGVGLTLVKRIAELHGGRVRAESDGEGAGTRIVVRIPLQKHAVLRREPETKPNGASRRVVVVEDQEDAREMFKLVLEARGHMVFEAADGKQAVAVITREHPDVAFVDIGLPTMSGYEVAREIRENQVLDDVVLVALTGYGTDDDLRAARDAGFDKHITKPADAQSVEQVLASPQRTTS